MTIAELLEALRLQGVHLRVDGGNLRVNAPAGVLTAERRAELSARKTEIIAFLGFAELVSSQQPAIVPLQALGSRTPIFAAAGHNGDVFCYRALANHLGSDQPFFGLQPLGYDPGTEPLRRVEDLAAYFARQIVQFKPNGPCIIVGYCAGGTVAFELTRQLLAMKYPVQRFVLIGAPLSTWYRWPTYSVALTRYWIKRLYRISRRALTGGGRQATRTLLDKLHPQEGRDGEEESLLARRRKVELATARAVMNYDPRPQDIHADIILPSHYVVQTRKSLLQWIPYLRSHREFTCTLDCTNETMLLPGSAGQVAELFVTSSA